LILGWLWLGETVSLLEALGTGAILMGVAWLTQQGSKSPRTEQDVKSSSPNPSHRGEDASAQGRDL
jgi:drug/metabolite transporter (DMT)-like permease